MDNEHEGAVEVTVRPVRRADAAMLCENCFSRNTPQQVRAVVDRNVRGQTAGRGVMLVAEVGGVVVGSATVVRHRHSLRAHRAEVESVVVHGDYRRRGIARRMMEEACRCASEMGVTILEISARGGEPAEEVYRRLGFREYGRMPGGLLNPGAEPPVFDEVYFGMPVTAPWSGEAAPWWTAGEATPPPPCAAER